MTSYYVGLFLAVGALVNDILVLQGNPATSLAKLLFVGGTILILSTGMPFQRQNVVDRVTIFYALFLSLIGTIAPNGLFSGNWRTVSLSLAIGLTSHFIFRFAAGNNFPVVARYYVAWAVIGALTGIIQALTGHLYFTERIFESTVLGGLHRASGFASDPNYFGLICLIAIPLIDFTGIASRRTMVAINLILIVSILLSGSRSSLMVLITYFTVIPFFWSSTSFFKKILISIAVAFFLVASLQFAPDSIKMLFDPTNYGEDAERNSLQDRALAALIAFTVGLENPILGYGLGSFRDHPANLHNQVSHNTYLELFAESGLLGVLAFLLLFLFHFRTLIRTRHFSNLSRAMISAQVMFLLMSLFLVSHYSRLLFFVTGLIAGAITFTSNEHPRPPSKTNT